MTNLTEQDNAKLLTQEECLISDMNERLKRLEDLYFSKGQETKQPIDTTEGEYAYILAVKGFTDGKIYLVKYKDGRYFPTCYVTNDEGQEVAIVPSQIKFVTHAEFLAQEQGKEWKEGEWAYDIIHGHCGIIINDGEDGFLDIDLQDDSRYFLRKDLARKPTDKDIETWLVSIAEKKYPVGTKFKDGNDKQFEISETEFDYDNRENALFGRCYEFSGWVRIWDNGKWAEIVAPIETEQRCQPKHGEVYWYLTEFLTPAKEEYWILTYDTARYNAGNCFKTEQEAQKAAEAIKQYLSTTKF
jgi:hypothetical protein